MKTIDVPREVAEELRTHGYDVEIEDAGLIDLKPAVSVMVSNKGRQGFYSLLMPAWKVALPAYWTPVLQWARL